MKKLVTLLLTVAVALSCMTSLIACKKSYTVTYYNMEGEVAVKIGEVSVKEGQAMPTAPEGYFLDSELYASAADFATSVDTDESNDAEGIDKAAGVTGNVSVYGTFIAQGLVTGDGYTYSYAMSVFPTVWNPFVYQTADDSEILGYVSDGFYTFDYNETKDGYKMVDAMAVGDPVDVTADYVGEQWGIAEGEQHKAWKVTIRSDLKWDDGTPIKAQDFVRSTELLLDPAAQNSRADDYTYAGDFIIHNAQNYLYQGQEGVFTATDLMSEADYVAATHDSKLIFSLAAPTANEKVYGTASESYFRTAVGFPASYDAAMCAAYVKSSYVPTLDLEVVAAMEGKTLAEIKADEAMAAEWNKLWGDFWGAVPGEEIHFCIMEGAFPEVDFANVGIKAVSDTEVVFILDEELKGFYLKYNLTGSWLVKEDVYTACAGSNSGVYTNSYCTTVANTPSYGAYKLTYFQKDKAFRLEKNPNWYGHKDDPDLYQTTNINVIRVANASTRLQMFLAGQLDSYGLTVNDMEEYQMSDHTYYTTGASTFFVAMNPNLEALKAKEAKAAEGGKNINKTILTIKEFRQALSFSLDRSKFALATSPTNGPAFAAFSSLIISNPETGEAYRTTEEAKDAVLAFWGLTEDVGEGKRYATKDEAIASITGYDLAGAKELFNTAYDKAVEAGLFKEGAKVEITIGLPNGTTSFYVNGYEFLVNNWTEAVKGTKLEGKLTFTKDDTLGNAYGDRLRDNSVDVLFGVGFTGSVLNPYGLVSVYSGNEESLRYDPSFDTTTVDITIPVTGLEGEGVEGVYTASMDAWTTLLSGKGITVMKEGSTEGVAVKVDSENYSVKVLILAAIERAVLEQYDMIPLIDDASAALKGMKYNYYTEEYIYGVGRGGVKYMTYNYTDSEWAEYVASQGGKLNYK